MSKEGDRPFIGGLREKGKTVLKRVASPTAIRVAASIGILAGATDMIVNPGNANEIDGQINERVSQTYPRTVSEEQYKLAKKEIKSFDKDFTRSPHQFIDYNTLSIKIPENVAKDSELIVQENTRSKDASVLKSQLKDQYTIDEAGTGRGLLIIGLSLLTYSIPDIARGCVSMFRKFKGVPSSPKSANS